MGLIRVRELRAFACMCLVSLPYFSRSSFVSIYFVVAKINGFTQNWMETELFAMTGLERASSLPTRMLSEFAYRKIVSSPTLEIKTSFTHFLRANSNSLRLYLQNEFFAEVSSKKKGEHGKSLRIVAKFSAFLRLDDARPHRDALCLPYVRAVETISFYYRLFGNVSDRKSHKKFDESVIITNHALRSQPTGTHRIR